MDPTVLVFVASACSGMCWIVCVAVALFAWWRQNQPVPASDVDADADFADFLKVMPEDVASATYGCAMDPASYATKVQGKCPASHALETGVKQGTTGNQYVDAKQCAASEACVTAVRHYAAKFQADPAVLETAQGKPVLTCTRMFSATGGCGPRGCAMTQVTFPCDENGNPIAIAAT